MVNVKPAPYLSVASPSYTLQAKMLNKINTEKKGTGTHGKQTKH
jgi:hypothetical protein